MRKSGVLLLLAFAIVCTGQAQNLVFHAGGGLTSHYGGSSRNIGALKLGVSLEFEMSQKLTVEPGLLYFAKGWKDPNRTVFVYDEDGNPIVDEAGNPRTAVMGVTSKTNYMVLPVLFNYYFPLSLPHYIYLSAGPYVAYGVGGKSRISGDTSQSGSKRFFYDHNTFSESGMNRFDAGIVVGVGYEFNRMINAGIEGNFGLADVNKAGRKNFSLMLTLGYRIPFGKK